jgi:hypothetical protein
MTFWIYDYTILFQKDIQIWPTDNMTSDEKLNAISRFVILLSLLGLVLTQSIRFLWIGVATLLIIAMFHNAQVNTQEAFTQQTTRTVPTEKNPLMNVLLPEINGNPNRGKALAHTPKTEKKIMEKVKKGLDPRIYRGTNNELDLEYSMRQFYTNPSTTVPNNQEEFATFCYGDMISAKEGNKVALARHNPRLGGVYT